MSDRIFRSPSFKNGFCSLILHFSGLITIRFVLDPALNLYFDLTIRGTDIVCIDWTLQVPLSFKWVDKSHHSSFLRIGLLVRWSVASGDVVRQEFRTDSAGVQAISTK